MSKLYKIRIRKDDTVIVRSGKYKGKTGKVISTQPADNTVIVEGINVIKKHQKPNKQYPQGGIVEITKPIDVSKVGIYEPTLKKASRISFKLSADGKKSRVYAKSGKEIK
jgi:large subunit ribosomal protein L24